MKRVLNVACLIYLWILAFPVAAALNVFACEPEWAALVQELAGDKATVHAATTALQDPHRIEARPSLIARARAADLVICSGSELEGGWLPLLLAQAGNNRIQPGSAGYFEASKFVARLEIPKILDRSLGDIHPSGNPHVHLDPRNIGTIAEVVAERLTKLDPSNADTYKARAGAFGARWRAALQRWQQQAAALGNVPVVVYHGDMSYFIQWAGMRHAGSLEPLPGIAPTPAHLADLVERMKRDPVRAIVYSPYNSPRAAEFLSERTGIPAVMLPFTVGGSAEAKDLFGLFDDMIAKLLAILK